MEKEKYINRQPNFKICREMLSCLGTKISEVGLIIWKLQIYQMIKIIF